MTVIGQSNSKKLLAGSVYLAVVLIVAAAWSLRGPAMMAANKGATSTVVEGSEVAGKEVPTSGDGGNSDSNAGQLDPAGLVEPALEVIRSTARKVIF